MQFDGHVTSAFSTYGIINEDTYFDYSAVVGDLPVRGSKVTGLRTVNGEDQYRASELRLVQELEKNEVTGIVTKVDGDMGVVNEIPFRTALCEVPPVVGDLLKLSLAEISGVVVGSRVTHVRRRRFTSYILRVTKTHCVLEDSTYVLRADCTKFEPRLRDTVTGLAVECRHREYTWRAVELRPSSLSASRLRPEVALYRLPGFCLNKRVREYDGVGVVECQPHALKVGHLNPGEGFEATFDLRNVTTDLALDMTRISVSDSSIVQPGITLPVTLPPSGVLTVPLHITNTDIGEHQTLITFHFSVPSSPRTVTLSRPIHINTIQPRTGRCLRPRIDIGFLDSALIIQGEKPRLGAPRFYPNHFPVYAIPPEIKSTSENTLLMQQLTPSNYKVIFHELLYTEERYCEEEMQRFTMHGVSLMKRGRFLILKVPGLMESKLSVLVGHRVVVALEGVNVKYEGFIHKVDEEAEDLYLGFDEGFHYSYNSDPVTVQFMHSRTSFIRCHKAVDLVCEMAGGSIAFLLFPDFVTIKPPHFSVNQLHLFNTSLNLEQREAVKHIIEAKARPIPYLLFGPPGTGKTVTVVEAILQIYHIQEDSRILVTAPSNSACDLLAERLLAQCTSGLDIVRLNSISRFTDHLPDHLQAICMDAEMVKEASLKRVIVATCITAGNLYKLSLRTSHFTHVFVDEAGQAIEPEVLLPIALSTGPGTQAVLAGDPYQLGPVIRNPQVEQLGLQVSYLERLMEMPLYERRGHEFAGSNSYDPVLITKLIRNYRSHEGILTVPSQMFYEGELLPCAPAALVNTAIESPALLPNPAVPIIFHGLRGEEQRELNNPSYFNAAEIVEVLAYVQKCVQAGISEPDIGIISPYKKQAEKIRSMLRTVKSLSPAAIKVASVEDFQGQERRAIIISTVRSNHTLDTSGSLGFLQNPKRFNVSITRAQAFLVVIGNPDVLKHDRQWGVFLEHCVEMGCYRGCTFENTV